MGTCACWHRLWLRPEAYVSWSTQPSSLRSLCVSQPGRSLMLTACVGRHGLERHPLHSQGYPSVGDVHSTLPVPEAKWFEYGGERSGRFQVGIPPPCKVWAGACLAVSDGGRHPGCTWLGQSLASFSSTSACMCRADHACSHLL